MMTIQNIARPGVTPRPIYHFRSGDFLVDLDVQQCKDFPDSVGKALMGEFDFLQCVSHTEGVETPATLDPVTKEVKESIVHDAFIAEQEAMNPIVCNICGERSVSLHGMNNHRRSIHPELPPPGPLEDLKCKVCGSQFAGEHGLKVHNSRMHKTPYGKEESGSGEKEQDPV